MSKRACHQTVNQCALIAIEFDLGTLSVLETEIGLS